jgi:hypothetical protein
MSSSPSSASTAGDTKKNSGSIRVTKSGHVSLQAKHLAPSAESQHDEKSLDKENVDGGAQRPLVAHKKKKHSNKKQAPKQAKKGRHAARGAGHERPPVPVGPPTRGTHASRETYKETWVKKGRRERAANPRRAEARVWLLRLGREARELQAQASMQQRREEARREQAWANEQASKAEALLEEVRQANDQHALAQSRAEDEGALKAEEEWQHRLRGSKSAPKKRANQRRRKRKTKRATETAAEDESLSDNSLATALLHY